MRRGPALRLGLVFLAAVASCSAWRMRIPPPLEGDYSLDLRLPPEAAGGAPPGPFRAGAAAVDITPDPAAAPVWLAGYGFGRRATGVHDPLWARALVLDDGRLRVALVALDLVGHFLQDTVAVRRALPAGLGIDYVAVASTHNHEGPDTLGLWGPHPFRSGVDPSYLDRVRRACVEAVGRAAAALRPVRLRATARRTGTEGYIRDSRRPVVIDDELVVLGLEGEEGGAVATVVVWSCHPEACGSKNTLVTSDYPHALRERLESERGGTCLFFAGSIGGLMTPPRRVSDLQTGEGHAEDGHGKAGALGRNLASVALEALAAAPAEEGVPALAVRARTVTVPLANWRFRLGVRLGVVGRGMEGGGARTEVGWLALGPVEILLVPGEVYPEIVVGGIERPEGADFPVEPVEVPPLKGLLGGRVNAVVGLANDELGYIIPRSEWDVSAPHLYGERHAPYGEINSVGPDAAPVLHRAIVDLLR